MNYLRRNLQLISAFLLFLGVVLGLGLFARPQATSDLKVYFLDVGQGDAEYIKNPDGSDILIDGGPDNSVLNQLGRVMDLGDHEINLVILSHPHADHLTGLLEVIRRYKIGEVWETGVEYSSATYDSWKVEIQKQGILDKKVVAGEKKNFGDVKIEILYPLSSFENKTIDNLNNASIVNRLDFKNFSVLFTGDAEKEIQQKLLDENIFIDILKAAHHGSENGLLEEFLKVVRPAVAVIEVGAKNTYGHPSQSTISLLEKYAVRIFRTDQNGTVEIDSDGQAYSTKSAR